MAEGRAPLQPEARARVLCVGDVLLDVLLREGVAEGRERVAVEAGGSAANTAAWLAWCGVAATLVGAVGSDAAGELLRRDIETRGVMPALQVHAASRSGAFVARVTPETYVPLATERGANDLLAWGPVEGALLAQADHLHVSGYALAHPVSCESARMAAARARERGLTVSLDLGAPHALRAVGASLDAVLTDLSPDVLFANLEEAATVAAARPGTAERPPGPTGLEDLVEDLAWYTRLAVLKEGPRGSRAMSSRGSWPPIQHDAPSVTVIDAVGAGDAFVAGFLTAWLAAGTLRYDEGVVAVALARATAVAAVCLERTGGRPPDR